MSSSQHPIALRLERSVGDATKLLAVVMFLPLLDGIFPALLLAGALDGAVGILQVGLLVFGGSATLAVILAEMGGTPREQATVVLALGVPLVALAAIEAALAPTIASLLDLVIFERFAALVIAAVAAKTASARIGEYLPRPAVIVGLGFVASLDPAGVQLAFAPDPMLVVRGAATAAVGVAFALGVAVLAPWLREAVDIDRFRFGSAIALGLLPLALLGITPDQAPLAVLVVAGVLAYDSGAGAAGTDEDAPSAPNESAVADGGEDDFDGGGAAEPEEGRTRSPYPGPEREPWQ